MTEILDNFNYYFLGNSVIGFKISFIQPFITYITTFNYDSFIIWLFIGILFFRKTLSILYKFKKVRV